uniref:Uncharacterized protein n=1 Tax=Anguilla anguilla TaxID=7936 RepID=A0A0E9RBX3_ANGAN
MGCLSWACLIEYFWKQMLLCK